MTSEKFSKNLFEREKAEVSKVYCILRTKAFTDDIMRQSRI